MSDPLFPRRITSFGVRDDGTNRPIFERDGYRCVVHGDRAQTVHHRNHNHGDNRPSNRISVCGSGTTGAHGWIEAHPAEAGLDEGGPGWTIYHGDDPAYQRVWYENGPYGRGWYLLDDEYGFAAWPGSVVAQERGWEGR